MNNLFRTTMIEIKANFTWSRMAGIAIILIISLIRPLASSDITPGPKGIEDATWGMLGAFVSQGVIYSLSLRIILLLKDNSTLDKNRALFLNMDKKQVVFGKVIADALLLFMSIVLVLIIGPIVVIYKNHGTLSNGVYGQLILFAFSMLFLYLLISVGLRYIVSTFKGRRKWVLFSIFITLTAMTYLALSIVTGLVDPVRDVFVDNKMIFMFIPFMNIGYTSLVLYGLVPMWTIVPLIIEILIFMIIIWKPLSTSVKEYLCG